MDDLVLRSRLDAVRRTLATVRDVRNALERQRSQFHQLEEKLLPGPDDSIQKQAGGLKRIVDDAVLQLEDAEVTRQHPQLSSAITDLRRCVKTAEVVRQQANEALRLVRSLESRWVEITDLKVGPALRQGFVAHARECENLLGRIEAEPLARAAEAEADDDADRVREHLRDAWRLYEDTLLPTSKPLFEEYVDLLGGLALRALGFDLGVAQNADSLLTNLDDRMDFPWSSVAVPAHTQALRMTVARIIRLGFPDWTRWNLPLAAHDFGHVVAGSGSFRDDIADHAATLAARWAPLRDLVVDLIDRWTALSGAESATQADRPPVPRNLPRVGPELLAALSAPDVAPPADVLAEALAAVPLSEPELARALDGVPLVAADVEAAIAGIPLDVPRLTALFAEAFATFALGPAYACAAVLLRFDPLEDGTIRGLQLSDDSRAQTVLATLRRMGAAGSSGSYDGIADFLARQWQAAVDQVGSKPAQPLPAGVVDAWNQRACDLLRRSGTHVEYSVRTWDRVGSWPELLLSDPAAICPDGTEDLRDILGVAWVCRLRHPDRVDDIDRAAGELWARVRPPAESALGDPNPQWGR